MSMSLSLCVRLQVSSVAVVPCRSPDNPIGDGGATAKALKENSTITEVNLGQGERAGECGTCSRAPVGRCITRGECAAEGEHVDIMGDDGATAIAEALEVNEAPTKVNLDCEWRSAARRWVRARGRGGGWHYSPHVRPDWRRWCKGNREGAPSEYDSHEFGHVQ